MDICQAIKDQKLVTFWYKGHQRTVVPGAYGAHKTTGNNLLRGYQVKGGRNKDELPGWGFYKISDLSDFAISDQNFIQIPPGYRKGDRDLSPIYCEL
jgi:hypothetical protein